VPALSVLLPVRDALPYLRPALASLRRQTFQDFEIIAVDDGSSDGSGEALEKAAARVPALHVIHTPPRGLPAALATALTHARGRWIARQDADDISHRRRFELQLEELRGSPETAVVGSRVRLFPAGEVGVGMRRWVLWHNALLAHQAMANEALIDSPLAHGSATMRRGWLERAGGWVDRGWPEDVDLWLRLIEAGARFRQATRGALWMASTFAQRHAPRPPLPAGSIRRAANGGPGAGRARPVAVADADRSRPEPGPVACHPRHAPAGASGRSAPSVPRLRRELASTHRVGVRRSRGTRKMAGSVQAL